MNALQTAVSMAFAGLLSVLIAYIVNVQAQMAFDQETVSMAQALADSVANQIRAGISSITLPNVYRFNMSIALPSFSPPFDSFFYSIKLVNENDILVVYVNMTAYRGSGVSSTSVYKAVYNITNIKIYAQGTTPLATCSQGDLVDLSQRGCYVVWQMPAPTYVKYLVFTK
ncbi:hypothetical protein [Pyrobaculum sp.]|uniref:hypothetical protein n=1 Tax=Pyrobaculum sp. TaxID=2004705 RepID=UPI003D0D8809